ncbi:8992_t:CDS:10 [Paraglomus brasilianum]|uniref:Chromatin-remodeling ATPase INO80 n=1 Tax=Paraglomus brasilianum TaxID=144538 RepID=A0A9N8W9L1_9GLOM|nr:8992_t:CDS:10 [Paraglomus brasilianum]
MTDPYPYHHSQQDTTRQYPTQQEPHQLQPTPPTSSNDLNKLLNTTSDVGSSPHTNIYQPLAPLTHHVYTPPLTFTYSAPWNYSVQEGTLVNASSPPQTRAFFAPTMSTSSAPTNPLAKSSSPPSNADASQIRQDVRLPMSIPQLLVNEAKPYYDFVDDGTATPLTGMESNIHVADSSNPQQSNSRLQLPSTHDSSSSHSTLSAQSVLPSTKPSQMRQATRIRLTTRKPASSSSSTLSPSRTRTSPVPRRTPKNLSGTTSTMTNPSSPAKTNAGGSNGKRRRDSSSSASSTADLSEKKDEIHDQNGFMDLSSGEDYGDMLLEYMKQLHQRQRKVVEDFEKRQKNKRVKMVEKWGIRVQKKPLKKSQQALGRGRRGKSPHLLVRKLGHSTQINVDRKRQESSVRKKEKAELDERRRIWRDISRNAIPKAYKIVTQYTSSRQTNARKIAQICQKEARKAQTKISRSQKDATQKSKQLCKAVLLHWKRHEKEEREARKKAEREALERQREEEERREAERQQRKLNFLITQTELYSHFIGKKIGQTVDAEAGSSKMEIDEGELNDDDELTSFNDINFDEVSDEALKAKARASAQNAIAQVLERTRNFDGERQRDMTLNGADIDQMNFQNPTSMPSAPEIKQPSMLMCQLKEYQLKGLNWLANLYEQGINGILADEMGLGKTVQSIALMAHLAETHNIWGPFLVIAPSSTLHNWQQEITKFVPIFKALPYWGNPNDRKTLRKFLNKKNQIYTRDAPFHIVITSYQLIVQDKAYFERTKWQYMILDEAQAIKSSSSARWRTLLAFQCRNRLLLTGTPIQNSMAELWALLHFIMPTLFDSHAEFSEWFSKDIESHAENKGTLNEHQLKRLHMILKPFMLRRIKKNVQNELGDKIEIEVPCELTARQRMLYRGLRAKISVTELLEKATSLNENESVDSLMNLVMQFRKVCNHPELFERADVVAPFSFCKFGMTWSLAREGDRLHVAYSVKNVIDYHIPALLFCEGGILDVPGHRTRSGWWSKYVCLLLSIWRADYIHRSIWDGEDKEEKTFSFTRFIGLNPSETELIYRNDIILRWLLHCLHNPSLEEHSPFLIVSACSNSARPLNPFLHSTSPKEDFLLGSTYYDKAPLSVSRRLKGMALRRSRTLMSYIEPIYMPKVLASPIEASCENRTWHYQQMDILHNRKIESFLYGLSELLYDKERYSTTYGRILAERERIGIPKDRLPIFGMLTWKNQSYVHMRIPALKRLIMDSGKLANLDKLLEELKTGGHRCLIYFQMTRMIDIMEEYLAYRQYKYLRLDGSSKISDRRDMVTDWQTRPDIFIFLLSTRAGGLGINLTAADTVIFYDSDWNPTVDQQAMDRAHRLGQTKQVTVYRLITRGTIEDRILQRAKQKDEIQKVVISGGEFKQVDFKPREIVSLLLDEEELQQKLSEQSKRKAEEESSKKKSRVVKRQKRDKNTIMTAGNGF